MKTPSHMQMMTKGRPSLWYCEWLDIMKIVYPDIYTQEEYHGINTSWTEGCNSTSVIRAHYEFLGWL